MDTIVEAARAYIKSRFLTELSREDGVYRYAHSLRVAQLGRRIAQAEALEEEPLVLGCLLHDIGYVHCRTRQDYADHGRLSAAVAEEFLLGRGYDPGRTESICYGIRIHTQPREALARIPTALEASVTDADNIDRFDAWRFSRSLYYEPLDKLSVARTRDLACQRLAALAELEAMPFATRTGQRLWRQTLALRREYYTRLQRQMEAAAAWDPEL